MSSKRLSIALAVFGLFSSSIAAEEAYRLVNVWPEAPQGWHFYQLFGVAVDMSGNVYVGDSGNYKVKKFDSEGRFIIQWGSPGQGDGQFSKIHGVRVGTSGTVYIVDENDHPDIHSRIQMFTAYGQFIGLFERTAPDADKADLSIDVTEDDKGNVFVLAVDYVTKERRVLRTAVEKYSPDREFISQWSMNAGSGDGQLQIPTAIDVDTKGNFYIVEYANDRVQKFDSSGKFLMKWGALDEGEGRFSGPYSIAIDKSGDVYVRDNYGIHKFTSKGELLAKWKMTGGPRGIALDSHSNVYVTNRRSHSVLKLDNTGKVISQWGCAGTGDGLFSLPGSIALDSSSNIFIADTGNNHIRKLDSEGNFLSNWGEELWFGVVGLATDASGNLYVAVEVSNEVQKYNTDGKLISRWGSKGSGDSQFKYATGIAVGPSGNVYVADTGNCRVQKFTNDGKFLAKWGTQGAGDGQFDGPFFIAVDGFGNVWVGDQLGNGTHRMQKFDADGRFLMKWTNRRVMRPAGTGFCAAVAIDSSGNSYYAFESQIEKYDPKGDLISTYGQEEFTNDRLEGIRSMCVDKAGCLYITVPVDPLTHRANKSGSIRKYDPDGKLVSTWIGDDAEGKENLPSGPITVDETGNVYVSHLLGTSIWKLSSDGKPVSTFQVEPPSSKGGFMVLGGVAVDGSGKVYAVDSVGIDWGVGIPSIKKFDSNGEFIAMWGVPEEAEGKFKYPAFIAVDGSGNAYVTDYSSQCIHKLDAQGKYIKSWGSKGTGDGQFDTPEGIAVDKSGNIYVCDRQNSRIQKFDSDGKFLTKWGKEGSDDGEFHFPAAVAIDAAGNVFVADSDNHRVQKFTADGKFLTEWGEFGEAPGQFNVPLGIAVDASGNVYVSDSHNHRIQKFAPMRSL